MYLVIDQGNTTIKTAIFASDDCAPAIVERVERLDAGYIDSLLARYNITACIYSSVTDVAVEIITALSDKGIETLLFTPDTRLPIVTEYHTPHTLGRDRVAAVVGAYYRSPHRDILIVDAGTCITYDLLTADGHHKGGNIAPGIKMRLRAMRDYTRRLPAVDKGGDTPDIGYDTETAMRAGAIIGICYEIEGYIAALRREYPQLLIFLTGGDAFLLADKLKSAIFVDESIVLNGLNRILHYNVKK